MRLGLCISIERSIWSLISSRGIRHSSSMTKTSSYRRSNCLMACSTRILNDAVFLLHQVLRKPDAFTLPNYHQQNCNEEKVVRLAACGGVVNDRPWLDGGNLGNR